ncbi:acyl transferase/acyl hydrolase/lysophospholipase [Mycena latifolia]|nr:acyl transferase/acyl hydrolase/lysophospholipase [Mycena latifolia]
MQANRAIGEGPSIGPSNPIGRADPLAGVPTTMSGAETAMRRSNTGLRLLSLDGGGIRGLSSLLILETIMYRIKVAENLEEPPLPCDYFDLIGGTNTGGIIAIMLGRLRMSVEQAIKSYDDLSGQVFRQSKLMGDGKYSATMLEKVIKAIIEERTGDSESSLLDDGALGGKCRIFVCSRTAHNMNAGIPVLFRSYPSPNVSIPCKVWEAARATSAMPTFFKHICIGPHKEPFIDGGMGLNNPTECVLAEVDDIFPSKKVACLLSIGTGQPEVIGMGKPTIVERNVIPVGAMEVMVGMTTDCEATAERVHQRFRTQPKRYFRFNVDHGLQKLKLDAWDRMDEVAAHTRQYMGKSEVRESLDGAVRAMLGRSEAITTFTSSTN